MYKSSQHRSGRGSHECLFACQAEKIGKANKAIAFITSHMLTTVEGLPNAHFSIESSSERLQTKVEVNLNKINKNIFITKLYMYITILGLTRKLEVLGLRKEKTQEHGPPKSTLRVITRTNSTHNDIIIMPGPRSEPTPHWWKGSKHVHCYVIPT